MEISNVHVDNNSIFGGKPSGVPALNDLVGTGIDITIGLFDLLSVCGNAIHINGYTAAGTDSYGVRIRLPESATTLNVNRNTIRDYGGSASTTRKGIYIDTPTSGDTS